VAAGGGVSHAETFEPAGGIARVSSLTIRSIVVSTHTDSAERIVCEPLREAGVKATPLRPSLTAR